MRRAVGIVLVLALLGVARNELRADSPPRPVATPWPEANRLFHQDPRWLGSDDAYSVDLGHNRILWLFADTFIAQKAPHVRRNARMIRNSIGIQRGADPTTASMQFYWAQRDGRAASFFGETDGEWNWPGDGILVDGTLLVFLMKVRPIPTGLGFEAFDWTAVAIDNPEAEPPAWRVRRLETPANPYHAVIGSGAVLRSGDHLLAYGSHEDSGKHDICLVRWRARDAARGDLGRPEWWDARAERWIAQDELRGRPVPVFTNGQTEFTIHFERELGRFVEVQTNGFGGASVAVRYATALTGPWSDLANVFHPPEADRQGVMIYAGKAHPELRGDGLALTFAVNAGWSQVLDDPELYYPRFLRLKFLPSADR